MGGERLVHLSEPEINLGQITDIYFSKKTFRKKILLVVLTVWHALAVHYSTRGMQDMCVSNVLDVLNVVIVSFLHDIFTYLATKQSIY